MNLIEPGHLYNDWASRYDDSIKEMGWSAHDEVLHALEPYLFSGMKILEIGIGTGVLAEKFQAACHAEVTGTDVSPAMMKRCLEKGICGEDRLLRINLETEKTSFTDCDFNMVVSCGVFEYVENIANVCAEASRLVDHNGLLAFCYEAGAEGDKTVPVLIRDRNGRDDNGRLSRGVVFSYKHPSGLIERILQENRISILSSKTFLSAVVNDEPVHYHLTIGRKPPLMSERISPPKPVR